MSDDADAVVLLLRRSCLTTLCLSYWERHRRWCCGLRRRGSCQRATPPGCQEAHPEEGWVKLYARPELRARGESPSFQRLKETDVGHQASAWRMHVCMVFLAALQGNRWARTTVPHAPFYPTLPPPHTPPHPCADRFGARRSPSWTTVAARARGLSTRASSPAARTMKCWSRSRRPSSRSIPPGSRSSPTPFSRRVALNLIIFVLNGGIAAKSLICYRIVCHPIVLSGMCMMLVRGGYTGRVKVRLESHWRNRRVWFVSLLRRG